MLVAMNILSLSNIYKMAPQEIPDPLEGQKDSKKTCIFCMII